jgi:hypothetical protein
METRLGCFAQAYIAGSERDLWNSAVLVLSNNTGKTPV